MNLRIGLRTRLMLDGAFMLMGLTFTATQALLVRELMVSFAGNELSIGLVLGSWLLLEALGSALLGRLTSRVKEGRTAYVCLQILLALILVPMLYAALNLRRLVGAVPGQGLGLPTIFLSSFLLLTPVGLIDGAMFVAGCKMAALAHSDSSAAVRRVYIGEAIGGIVGGFAFTYCLAPYCHSVQIVLFLGVLNLASATSLLLLPLPNPAAKGRSGSRLRPSPLAPAILLAVMMGLLFTPVADRLHRDLVARQWPGFELAFYENSPYGNVAAIRQGEQITFLENGAPILSAPVPDVAVVEEMVHLPMLFVPQPRRALVLSGGLGGVIGELLKYPLERIDYAELDPLLIHAVASLPTSLTQAELSAPRLHVEPVDGRLLVRRLAALSSSSAEGNKQAAYDLILINLPYPTTLQVNRFYTVEFWRTVRSLLAEDGVLAFQLPGSLSYLSPAMRDLHNSLYLTLAQVFAHVRPIPDDMTLWLATPSAALETLPTETLVSRWQTRGVSASLITPFHIRLKLDERHLEWFWGALRAGRSVTVNRDLRPSGVLYGLEYWNEVFSPTLVPYFALLRRVSLPALAVPIVLLVLGGAIAVRSPRGKPFSPIASAIATTGFAGMAADLLILFAFQVFYGYVYQYVGLLVAAFMGGLSLGGWMMGREGRSHENAGWPRERRRLLRLEGGLLVFWLVLPVVLTLLHGITQRGGGSTIVGPALLALNALAGFLVGAQFPLANRIYRRAHPEVVGTAGLLYAADLTGACAAAVLVSVALLPTLGIVQTCLLVAALKAGSFLLVWSTKRG